ncbi:MAG: hypothetical protein JKY65_33090 [Planctomycetes bacterium]|nr:hypothetical protein [Planctomycetota bacterium]
MNRINLTSTSLGNLNPPSYLLSGSVALSSQANRLSPSAEPGEPSLQPGEEGEGVRWDLIRRLRREIAAGTYANQDRWQRALEGISREAS